MANTKISDLTPASALTGAEKFPAVQASATVATTAHQILMSGAATLLRAPPKIVFAGDSIMDVFGSMGAGSPFFWSTVKKPRQFAGWQNRAVSGSYSGTITSPAHTAVNGTDLNTPAKIAQVIADAPDILFVESGGNDGSANLTDTIANITAFVLAILASRPLCRIVIFTSPPQTSRSGAYLVDMRARLYALSRAIPNILVCPLELSAIDDTTSHAPRGAAAGGAGAMTIDGQHPSPVMGKAMEPVITRLLDDLGVPTFQPLATSQNDRYDPSTLPGGNLLGRIGSMSGGTSSGVGGNVTGQTSEDGPSGITLQVSTDSSELTAVSATGGTLSYQGNTFRAQTFALSAGGALTDNRTLYIGRASSLLGTGNGRPLMCTLLVDITGVVGLMGMTFGIRDASNNVNHYIGGPFGWPQIAAAEFIGDSVMALVCPYHPAYPSGANIGTVLNLAFRKGTTPSGTIKIAQWVAMFVPAYP